MTTPTILTILTVIVTVGISLIVWYLEKIIDMLDFLAWVCDGAPNMEEIARRIDEDQL